MGKFGTSLPATINNIQSHTHVYVHVCMCLHTYVCTKVSYHRLKHLHYP